MGTVFAELTFNNIFDQNDAEKGLIKPEQVRTATVTAIADTGAMYNVITEELYQQLGLIKSEDVTAHIANGQDVKCLLTKPVEIIWKNRRTSLPALVIPGAKKILLGVLAMEAMDLTVNPISREVEGLHGDHVEVLAL